MKRIGRVAAALAVAAVCGVLADLLADQRNPRCRLPARPGRPVRWGHVPLPRQQERRARAWCSRRDYRLLVLLVRAAGPTVHEIGRRNPAGGIAMPAADDLRRVLRRAAWRPRAMLRGFWVRLRPTWRGE